MDYVAQLMDHHVVSDGMRCLDVAPVEEQLLPQTRALTNPIDATKRSRKILQGNINF